MRLSIRNYMISKAIVCSIGVFAVFGFCNSTDCTTAPIRFRDVGPQAGLTTVPHFAPVKQYLVEMMGGGVALFDCDNDGKLDIVTVNDSTVDNYLKGGDLMVTLYRQDTSQNGPFHFTDVTAASGMSVRGWGMGVAVGDFDNDGLPDLYVTGYGHNVLYHNLGGCKFEDVTAKNKDGRGWLQRGRCVG